jgi:hypothetical protein
MLAVDVTANWPDILTEGIGVVKIGDRQNQGFAANMWQFPISFVQLGKQGTADLSGDTVDLFPMPFRLL